MYHPQSMMFSWLNLLRLLLLAGLGAFGLWALRGPPKVGNRPWLQRREILAFLGLLGIALALRILLLPTLPPGLYELTNVPYDRVLSELTDQIGFKPQGAMGYADLHTPLLPTFLDGWFLLGDAVGMGGSIVWLRLPNLFAAAAMLLLLVRLGRGLGSAPAGWSAAAVFALSPTLIPVSIYQGHYFLEMVMVCWFCERLVQVAVEDRPVHRSLAAAGVAALWTGYMAALVVVPGMLLSLALAWRRGQRRRGLAAVLVVAALYGPIATTALETTFDFLSISVTAPVDEATAEGMFAAHGHHPMTIEASGIPGLLRFPLEASSILHGEAVAWIALLGLLLALVLRPRLAWFPVLLLALFATLSTQMAARWINYTAVLPVLLLVPLWGAALPGQRMSRPWLQIGAVAIVSAILLIGPVLSPPHYDRLPTPGQLARWVLGAERLSQISAPLQTTEHRSLPVLVLAVEKDVYYHTCADRETLEGSLACKDAYFLFPQEDGFRRGLSEGRPLAFSCMEDIGQRPEAPCPRVDALRRDPAWQGTPTLVLVTPEFRRYEADGFCRDTFPRIGCTLLTEAVDIQVFRCPPRW